MLFECLRGLQSIIADSPINEWKSFAQGKMLHMTASILHISQLSEARIAYAGDISVQYTN